MAISKWGRTAHARHGGGRGFLTTVAGGLALGAAIVAGAGDARAESCATPACHLKVGKALLDSDPRRAADELLASYQLDERTDTLSLYATALERDRRYARALETWKRVIVFRDSELDAAKDAARTTRGRKRDAARAAEAKAQAESERAASAIIALWPHVGKVKVRVPDGEPITVVHDGAEVDVARDVLVNADHDELVFTGKDGREARVEVKVAAGAIAKIDAPALAQVAVRSDDAKPATKLPASARGDAAGVNGKSAPQIAARAHADDAPEVGPRSAPLYVDPMAPSVVVTAAPPRDDAPRGRTLSRVGIGLAATGLVAGGVAGGLAYLARRDFDRAQSAGCSAAGQCPFGRAGDLAQRSNDRARAAQLTAIGAGVLAAAGVTLYLVDRRRPHPTEPTHAIHDLALHVGAASTAISGSF